LFTFCDGDLAKSSVRAPVVAPPQHQTPRGESRPDL
jgi:hypothetical protein